MGATKTIATRRQASSRADVGGPVDGDGGPAHFVAGSDVPRLIVVDYAGARLNDLLGGIRKGALLVVVGASGSGKSTCCAELAAFAAHYWSHPERSNERQPNCKIYWIDSDQKDPSLVRDFFRGADVEGAFVHRVRMLAERHELYSFGEAIRLLPEDARVLVCDTLERWGTNDTERLAVLDKLRAHPAWLKIVIVGTYDFGGPSDVSAFDGVGDATIYAERTPDARYTLRFRTRRWQPCASARARCAGRYAESMNKAALSERAAAAHARLIRSWPWKESVRAKTIAQALLIPGLEELRAALCGLLGKADDSPLNANEVGNALKIVRDVIMDGIRLTRDLDRNSIARWRLVTCDLPRLGNGEASARGR